MKSEAMLADWVFMHGRLSGVVTAHPSEYIPDGSFINTTQVVEGTPAEGATVTTASGTTYVLGRPLEQH